ncbi:MAG: OmpA family protein [Vicinamibacterales bacterium]
MRTGPTRPVAADRWVVPYADLVTLLLAFFITLYAVSRVDLERFTPASTALQAAFDGGTPAAPPAGGPPALVAPPRVVGGTPLDAIEAGLQQAIAQAGLEGRVGLTRDERGVVLSLPESAAFDSGRADLTPGTTALLTDVGRELQPLANDVRVEGHTDDRPVSSVFRSNWELSTARASAVVALFIERAGVDARRLSAAGYGEFHPRVPNTSADARAQNRRVDIVILSSRAREVTRDRD